MSGSHQEPYIRKQLRKGGATLMDRYSNFGFHGSVTSRKISRASSDAGDSGPRSIFSDISEKVVDKSSEDVVSDSLIEPSGQSLSGKKSKLPRKTSFAFPIIKSDLNVDLDEGDDTVETSLTAHETDVDCYTYSDTARPTIERSYSVNKRKSSLSKIPLPQSAASFYIGDSPLMEVVESCESINRLNSYLKASRDEVNAGVPGRFLHAVMGQDFSGRLLELKRPHLYWTPCAAHCLDLMLEDIGKLPNIKRTLERAISLNGYIYNRSGLLNMMRRFTGQRELLRPAKTRFATAFITLSRLHEQKNNLRKMFTSSDWSDSKWAKEQKGKTIANIVLMPSFWNTIVFCLKVSGPLVRVLRLVDGEKKAPMGYIYEAMNRAKDAIVRSFNGNEEKYKEIFNIIDKRWEIQLHWPLHAAGYFLNPEFFYDKPEIEHDAEIMSDLYKCILRLTRDPAKQEKVVAEVSLFTNAQGLFGNELAVRTRKTRAPDVSLVASTIMYAFYLNETRKIGQFCTVPVINMKRADLSSHAEIKWLLNSCQIDQSSLIFLDEIDLSYYDLFGGLKLVLLNGDRLPTKQEAFKEAVVEIFGCKKDSEYPWVETVTAGQDCSCCTLIAENFALYSPEILAGKGFSRLLLASILLDTGNLTYHHCTSKDKYIATLLINGAGRFGCNGLYQILRYKMYDVSDLKVKDILRKDFKKWMRVGKPDGAGSRGMGSYIGMSSIGISVAQLLAHKDTATQEIIYFQQSEKIRLLMIVSGYYDRQKNFKRELLVSAESVDLMKNLLHFFNSNASQLPLKVLHQPGLRDEMRAFEVDQVTSRRTIEQLLDEFGGTSKR